MTTDMMRCTGQCEPSRPRQTKAQELVQSDDELMRPIAYIARPWTPDMKRRRLFHVSQSN